MTGYKGSQERGEALGEEAWLYRCRRCMQTRLENQTDGLAAGLEKKHWARRRRKRQGLLTLHTEEWRALLHGNFELGRKSGNYYVGKTVISKLYSMFGGPIRMTRSRPTCLGWSGVKASASLVSLLSSNYGEAVELYSLLTWLCFGALGNKIWYKGTLIFEKKNHRRILRWGGVYNRDR